MIYRPGAMVRLINDARVRELGIARVRIGTEGRILATRPNIDDQVLVKFKGCSSPLSISRTHLEVLDGHQ